MTDREDLHRDKSGPIGGGAETFPDEENTESEVLIPDGEERESAGITAGELDPDDSDIGSEPVEDGSGEPIADPETDEVASESEGDLKPELIDGDVQTGAWAVTTGALLLGALDPADAAAAGQAIANDAAACAEIVSLLPVADILTSLYQTQSSPSASQEANAQGAVTTRSPGQPTTARPKSQPVTVPKGKGISPAALATIGLGILAALGILWALAQRDQTSTREQEIHALQTRVADLEIGGNASVFVLNPVSDSAAGGKATVFYSPGDGTVLLSASGLPQLDDDQVYQVWYQQPGDDKWQPGPTFRVNDSGEIVRRLGSEAPGFENMGISIEPAPGSAEPTSEFLLQGTLVRAVEQ